MFNQTSIIFLVDILASPKLTVMGKMSQGKQFEIHLNFGFVGLLIILYKQNLLLCLRTYIFVYYFLEGNYILYIYEN